MKIILLILCLTLFSSAEERLDHFQVDQNWLDNNEVSIKRINRGNINNYIFSLNGKNIYMMICDEYNIERIFHSKKEVEVTVFEYDVDRDGKIDGIILGKDCVTFYPYIITYKNKQVIIQSFPHDWMNGKTVKFDNRYDTFMRFLKHERRVDIPKSK